MPARLRSRNNYNVSRNEITHDSEGMLVFFPIMFKNPMRLELPMSSLPRISLRPHSRLCLAIPTIRLYVGLRPMFRFLLFMAIISGLEFWALMELCPTFPTNTQIRNNCFTHTLFERWKSFPNFVDY